MDAPIKLLGKLNAIMAEAGYIKKDKKNLHFGYMYASEQAIKEKLHPLFVSHGVLLFPLAVTQVRTLVGEGKERECFSDVSVKFRVYDCDSGEYIDGEGCGTGSDKPGDKAPYKAWTGALKYILTTLFLIPTGDDPESDSSEPPSKAAAKPATASKSMPADLPLADQEKAHKRLKEILVSKGIEGAPAAKFHASLAAAMNGGLPDHLTDAIAEWFTALEATLAQPAVPELTKEQRRMLSEIKYLCSALAGRPGWSPDEFKAWWRGNTDGKVCEFNRLKEHPEYIEKILATVKPEFEAKDR